MTLRCLPGSSRPFQSGYAVGTTAGRPHQEPVDWLIDTGADWSAVRPSVAASFTISTANLPANTGPPAGAAYYLASGIDVRFTIATGQGPVTVTSPTPVIAIKRSNVGSNLLGVPQFIAENVEVRWDARTCTGQLRR